MGMLRRRRDVARRGAGTTRAARPAVLVIVQNMSVPLDRRVWQECHALLDAGYAVSVICPRGPGQRAHQVVEGVKIHTYRPAPGTTGTLSYLVEFAYCWLRTALLSFRVWRRDGFDVIQACNPPDTYFLLARLYQALGVRFVFDQHDLCPEVYSSRFARSGGLALRALLALERATYRTADHVLSTNESYRAIAMRRGGVAPSDVTVVRSGPDPEQMRPGQPVPELRAGREHLCCWLGIMGPQDGVDLLLRSIATLVHDHGREDCSFALLGYGDCLDDLRRLTTDLGLDPWVTFTGPADPQMIADYLSTADIGLSSDPSSPLNDVSTMNKTMEYMAYGLPVVAYDLKETRVSAEDAAVYVEPNEPASYAKAISDLLDSPGERTRLGRIGRARVEGPLSWQRQVPGYVGAFDRVLGPAADIPTDQPSGAQP
jgi:glycosyltransferase involved in cell wall biosynthesis